MSTNADGVSASETVPGATPPLLSATPTPRGERISSIDVIRGFALLGILLMNIVGFGLYSRAYDNPTAAGGASGINLWIWIILHVFAEGKMRCIFSLVFGASVVLLTSRLEGRADAADIYYRRTLWLLAFGIVHAYLLWQGDILYPYALCGFVLYPFRNLRARKLLLIGLGCMVFLACFNVIRGYLRAAEAEEARVVMERADRGQPLNRHDRETEAIWNSFLRRRNPSGDTLRADAEGWRGNILDVIKARGRLVNEWNSVPYYTPTNFDIWGMMFIGMAVLKFGILGAGKPSRFYLRMIFAGYSVGILVNSSTAYLLVQSNFDPVVHLFTFCVYDVGRLSIALGHVGLLLLLCKHGWLTWLTSRLGAVGQMALSNYILTSAICAIVFTGYGFGLYGQLERYQLYYVVAGISLFQLIASPIWLRHYRFGPLEWCWRGLTYWQRPPMRLAVAPVVSAEPPVILPALPEPATPGEETLPPLLESIQPADTPPPELVPKENGGP